MEPLTKSNQLQITDLEKTRGIRYFFGDFTSHALQNCEQTVCSREANGEISKKASSQHLYEEGRFYAYPLPDFNLPVSYNGELKQGLPDGEGKLVDMNGVTVYEGEFEKGKLHGAGKLFDTTGSGIIVCEGIFQDGSLVCGKHFLEDSGYVEGKEKIVDGKLDALAKLSMDGSLKYKVEISKRQPNGIRIQDQKDGSKIEGVFKESDPVKERLIEAVGKVISQGDFADCEPHERGIFSLKDVHRLDNFLTSEKTFGSLPTDLQTHIRSFTSPKDIIRHERVCHAWKKATPLSTIKGLNNGIALHEIFPNKSASEIVDWIVNNPFASLLQNANFRRVKGFNNACFEKLFQKCRNLEHLLIPWSSIDGDALKHLANASNLKSLNIVGCRRLEPDALKHLVYTPKLQSLDISYCKQFESGALKNLVHTPKLQSLDISYCRQLESDALKHLANTRKLLNLYLYNCDNFEPDPLRHLVNTPDLQSIEIVRCNGVKSHTLKRLEHTPKLLSLVIEFCEVEVDALKHLPNIPKLQILDISHCTFEADALKNLVHTPNLQCLNLAFNKNLEPEVLKHLAHTPKLQLLDITGCEILEANLKHLANFPKLRILNPKRNEYNGFNQEDIEAFRKYSSAILGC